jgi:hypothetical protein
MRPEWQYLSEQELVRVLDRLDRERDAVAKLIEVRRQELRKTQELRLQQRHTLRAVS